MTQTPYVSTDEIRSLFFKAISDTYRAEAPQYGTLSDPESDIDATALKEEGAYINHLTPRTLNIDAARLEMPEEALNKSFRMSGSQTARARQNSYAANEARSAFEVALGAAVLDQIRLHEDAQTRSIPETLHQLASGVAA